jgi:hypothetical protein
LPRRRTAIGERSIGAFTRENVFVVGNNLNGPCIDLAYIDKARRKESLDRRLTFLMIFTTISQLFTTLKQAGELTSGLNGLVLICDAAGFSDDISRLSETRDSETSLLP